MSALFAVLYALVYEGIFPGLAPAWLALALLPLCAFLAPALPFSLWVGRSTLLVWSAATVAVARVFLCLPAFPLRLAASCIVVAAGTIFLGKAVGYLDRRSVSAGAATALVLDQLLRFAGWSYDLSVRPAWLPVQLLLAVTALAVAAALRREPAEPETSNPSSLERRAGGMRLRGACVFTALLFLEFNVLGSAAVAHRWLELPYPVAAFMLTVAGGGAALAVAGLRNSLVNRRSAAVGLALVSACAAIFAQSAGRGNSIMIVLCAAGHAFALLLLERALVPAFGRRRGWRLAAGMAVFLTLIACWVLTFFYAFTVPAFQGGATSILVVVGLLLVSALAFAPRPTQPEPPLITPPIAAAAFLVLVLVAGVLALRPARAQLAATDSRAPAEVRIATYNIRYGFDENWRYDPERIARTIEDSGADVVGLQEVPAGLVAAYGTDLALWLGQRLGKSAHLAPSINGLLGDAVLSRLPVIGFASHLLPPEESDRKQIARASVLAGADTLAFYVTHFGIDTHEQLPQAAEVLRIVTEPRAVLMGDLNAEPGSETIRLLYAEGFRDAFRDHAGPPPTSPATRPIRRIDWILVRGLSAVDPAVSDRPGSDHRLVSATIRPD